MSAEKPKICHVLEAGELSGCGRMVAAICSGLDPERFDIVLAFAVRPGTLREDFEASFPSHVRKYFIPEMVRSINPLKDLAALLKLWVLFRQERPEVVHAHSSKAGVLARFAAWGSGIKKIFYSPHGYSFRMTDISRAARTVYFLAEWVASRIGHIVANGPNEARLARQLSGLEKVHECYNAIDIDRCRLKSRQRTAGPLRVVTCGRITTAKYPEAFVRLAARLSGVLPDITFLWIGGGEAGETQELLDLARQHRLHEKFHITGWLRQDRAWDKLAQADVVVHYSRWDVLPTSVLESMALERPVVGSTTVEQIIHGVTGFVARDEDQLYYFVKQLLEDTELRTRFGSQARQIMEEQYSLSRLIEELETVYGYPRSLELAEQCATGGDRDAEKTRQIS
jgi:glycosyltransferase involved in cell wall biosynthesis